MEVIKPKVQIGIDIFKFINIVEIQRLLINYPHLYIMFEFLCLHINDIINTKGNPMDTKGNPMDTPLNI